MNPWGSDVKKEIEDALQVSFGDDALLQEALTHSSFRNESKEVDLDNERLEFLGDAVIGAVVSEMLWAAFPGETEGVLSRFRSELVSEAALAQRARDLDLGRFLALGKGEEQSHGREKPSILASAYEAILAAVYLGAGMDTAKEVLKRAMDEPISALSGPQRTDYKTQVQEVIQSAYHHVPTYRVDREIGPDHDKIYEVSLLANAKVYTSGRGRSKKEAGQDAARKLLELYADNPDLFA